MIELLERITFDSDQYGGRPCIRGLQIRVTTVLDLLGNDLTIEEVLDELSDLEREDVLAALRFASQHVA